MAGVKKPTVVPLNTWCFDQKKPGTKKKWAHDILASDFQWHPPGRPY